MIQHLLLLASAAAAAWLPQKSGSDAQLRGLVVVDAQNAWASGFGGTLLRTRDGKRWEKVVITGGEKLDFRDLEAPDASTRVLMSVGNGEDSRIYRSTDGGENWNLVHKNPDEKGFYDAIAFWDAKSGLLLGDPVGGRFVVRVTGDGGRTWYAPKGLVMPEALEGEGAFAASGTCLFALKGGDDAWFVTGGAKVSRVFHTNNRGRTWTVAETPVTAANASSGLFSIVFADAKHGFALGGDYKQPKLAGLNGVRTEDGGATWLPAPVSATGFYSAVVTIPATPGDLVVVGPVGSARSHDGGHTWRSFSGTPLNAVSFFDANTGWAVGPKGTIVKFGGAP
jgi:photosystem II stability/assembly factor-like uncharacterized protein